MTATTNSHPVMQKTLIVVDDFLDNAAQLREAAVGLEYPAPPAEAYYSGRNSAQRVNLEGVTEQVSRLVGEALEPVPGTGHGKFRLTLEGDEGRGDIHIDSQCHWSGIYYLSRPEDCRGGTEFFRHLPTGMERCPLTAGEFRACGMNGPEDLVDKIIKPHSRDRSKWERTMTVPMKFNRLILFRPWLWHGAGPGFGDSAANGRLIYLLFFR
ncbi:MAG: DUF6445 family protein, partial [Wenzhouxiangellaceae bacterium]